MTRPGARHSGDTFDRPGGSFSQGLDAPASTMSDCSSAGASAGCEKISRCLDSERPDRAGHARRFAEELRHALALAGVAGEVSSRLKSPRSISQKMRRQGLPLDALHDVCGVRVLVDSVPECYQVLRVAYDRWPHVPEAFDDYIVAPKENGYQSLHAVLRLPCGHTIEVQIRTHAQHHEAEFGAAAHWRYKLATTD